MLTMVTEYAGYWGGAVSGLLLIPYLFLRAIATNRYVTAAQKKFIFSRFLNNPRFTIATAVGEPAGGTDIHLPYDEGGSSILKVIAHRDGKDWVLNGDKMYSSSCGAADMIMVAARTDKDAPVSKAMSFFWVPTDSPGLSITPNRMTVSEFGGNCQTYYDNVHVPESHLIGEVNKGYSIIGSFFEAHLPGISGTLGVMQKVYELMRDYAKQRVVGGKPLIRHSSAAAKLGEMATNIEAMRALMYRSAWEMDQKQESGYSALGESNWFWFVSSYSLFKHVSWRFCELATDIYGGMSASAEFPISSFLSYIYYLRAAGLTVNTELIRAGWDYDGRYRSDLQF